MRIRRSGAAALVVAAVTAFSLIAGGSGAQATSESVEQRGSTRAECTVGVDTLETCFPDAVLANAVAAKIGIAVTDVPTQAQFEGVTSVAADGTQSLEGVQHLVNLNWLTTADGGVVDLTPLESLTQLTYLYLAHNQIVDVTPLGSLTEMKHLFLHDNQIVDVTPLGALTHLITLGLSSNLIVEVAPLEDLTELTSLDLSENQIVNVSPLASLTNLGGLLLLNNQIVDVSSLRTLTTLTRLNLFANQIVDIEPLGDLTGLVELNVGQNPLREAPVFDPGMSFLFWGAIAESPEYSFTRGSVEGSVVLRSGLDAVPSNFASEYRIDGNTYTYVYRHGSGSSTRMLYSTGDPFIQGSALGTSVLTPRGDTVTSRMGDLDRRVEREVTSSGAITHTVTMTNPATATDTVTTRFYDAADTELNGFDNAPIYSDGEGGFYIEDAAMTLYLQPTAGIDQAFGGKYGLLRSLRDLVENGIDDGAILAPSAGLAAGDEVVSGVDTAIYYVTPSVTLAPGESYTYSYRESLFVADEDAQIQIDYVDDLTGAVVPGATQSFTGSMGDTLELTAADLVVPAGYILERSVSLPMTVTFGENGLLTTVQIPVTRIPADTVFTVTFDTMGGSAIAPIEVDAGQLLTLPAEPTRGGFTFNGWVIGVEGEPGVQLAFDSSLPIMSDITLYAQWVPVDSGPGNGDGNGSENGDGNGSGNNGENSGTDNAGHAAPSGGLAATGAVSAAPLVLGGAAAIGILAGLVLMVRRRLQ